METIKLSLSSPLARYYGFLTCLTKDELAWKLERIDSCAMVRNLLILTLSGLIALPGIFFVVREVFASLFLALYVMVSAGLWPWQLPNVLGDSWLEAEASLWAVALTIAPLAALAYVLFVVLLPETFHLLGKKIDDYQSTNNYKTLHQLYLGFKDKHCSKIEITD